MRSDVDVFGLDIAVEYLVLLEHFKDLAHLAAEVHDILFLELLCLERLRKCGDILGDDEKVKLLLSLVIIGGNVYVVADSADVDYRADKVRLVEQVVNIIVVVVFTFECDLRQNSICGTAVDLLFRNLVDSVSVNVFKPFAHLPGFKRLG